MSDIKVNIVGEFNKKGFVQAENATDKLDRSFKKLGKTLFSIFAAQQVYNFGKASVKAFAEEDRAVKNLTQSLQNLGLGYNVGAIERFISATQAATGVNDSQLRPAMVELIQVTMDAQKATELLQTAMDLSAGTGASLDSAVTALSRAYNGNYTTLGKLQKVYTTAQLKAMGFDKSVESLNKTFGGTAAANADSYQGKIDRLSIAFDEAKETIGKGLVKAFETLADGDFDRVLEAIASGASKLATLMNNIAFSIEYTKALLKTGWTIGKDEAANLADIRRRWTNPSDTTNTPAANRIFLRNMSSQLKIQKKITDEKKKSAALTAAEQKNQAALAKAKAVFDLEKIQIEAALKGKITEEERTRLLLLKAIAEENGKEADRLTAKLGEIQKQTADLANALISLKAGDPFSEWGSYFDSAKKLIDDLFTNFKNQTKVLNDLTASIASSKKAANSAVLAAKTDKATAYAQASQASGVSAAMATNEAAQAIQDATAALNAATNPAEQASAQEWLDAANASAEAASLLTDSLGAADLATSLAELSLANEYLNQSIEAASSVGVVPEVTVNVAGSVISDGDLVEMITDEIYRIQKTGKRITLSSIGI